MKKILSLLIVAMLSLGIVAFVPRARAANEAMFADPDLHHEEVFVFPTAKWWVAIKVANLTKVTTIAFNAQWNNTAINVTDIQQGNITQLPSFIIGDWDPSMGFCSQVTIYTTGTAPDITTPQIAFYLGVVGLAYTDGDEKLDITAQDAFNDVADTLLSGDCPNDHTVELVVAPPPPPYSPTATFTFAPPGPYEGDPVNFDASASTGGWDGASFTNITNWSWDWDNDGIFDENNTNALATHSFSPAGTYPVTLQVLAPPGPGYNVSYVETDDFTDDVMVFPHLAGRQIDLFTQDWRYPGYTTIFTGVNPPYPNGSQVDSYAPQDLVILYAKLTYNGEPICYKEVAFEVHGPANPYQNISIYRQVFTNGSGIAMIEFRIPWPDVHAEDIVFGVWWAMAKASVANEWVHDMHWWYVGWIVNIVSITASTPVEELSYLNVTVNLFNLAMMPRNVTLTATLYDELKVPVGSVVLDFTDIPPGASGPYVLTIFVPEWAYVGTGGKVYVNAFTALPWVCGVCWCPEASAPVWIKPTDPHYPPF